MHRKKGIDPLLDGFIQTAPDIPDAALLFVGPDEDNFTLWINSHAGEAGLSDRVMIAGPINGEERFEILRRSWAFALTSYSEGFSMAVLEALACRTPVIISPSGYFPEAIQAGAGVLTEPDAGSVAMAIGDVLGDEGRKETMGAAGRRLIESRYTIQHTVDLIVKMYADIV